MKHYTNKKTFKVFGYDNFEVAENWDKDSKNLIEMSDELFQQYQEQPIGHRWSLKGWIFDEALMKEHEEQEISQTLLQMHEELEELEKVITRLERIRDRTELEQQELNKLIDESTFLYREIKKLEAGGEPK